MKAGIGDQTIYDLFMETQSTTVGAPQNLLPRTSSFDVDSFFAPELLNGIADESKHTVQPQEEVSVIAGTDQALPIQDQMVQDQAATLAVLEYLLSGDAEAFPAPAEMAPELDFGTVPVLRLSRRDSQDMHPSTTDGSPSEGPDYDPTIHPKKRFKVETGEQDTSTPLMDSDAVPSSKKKRASKPRDPKKGEDQQALEDNEKAKHEKKKAKNRKAASDFRQRSKQRMADIESRVEALTEANRALTVRLEQALAENARLTQLCADRGLLTTATPDPKMSSRKRSFS